MTDQLEGLPPLGDMSLDELIEASRGIEIVTSEGDSSAGQIRLGGDVGGVVSTYARSSRRKPTRPSERRSESTTSSWSSSSTS